VISYDFHENTSIQTIIRICQNLDFHVHFVKELDYTLTNIYSYIHDFLYIFIKKKYLMMVM